MVDPWKRYPNWNELHEWTDEVLEEQCKHVSELFKDNTRTQILRMNSQEAAGRFADHSVDWVFIDANHDYAFVMEDMTLWYPKVKRGGLFSGHDYKRGYGVVDAVDDFFRGMDIKFNTTDEEDGFKSWFVWKP
jgi:hypothetical protein